MNQILLNQPLRPNLKKLSKYLDKINENGWFTNFGPFHLELTYRLEEFLGVKNLLLVSNGTVALQVAARALHTTSIISTPFSFVATGSAFKWMDIPLCFADINRQTYNLCPFEVQKSLENKNHIDTIVATHVFSNPCNVIGLNNVAESHNKKIIYDAAHAFGTKINGDSVLLHGDASTLSFHATKVFHTVEGGAIVFKDKHRKDIAERLINFGIDRSTGEIKECGINAKLSEYNSAVGLVLLDEMDKILEKRAALYHQYRRELSSVVELQEFHPEANYNGSYFPICFPTINSLSKIQKALSDNGIQSRAYFSHSIPDALNIEGFTHFKNTKEVAGHVLCLPLHYYLETEHILKISKIIKNCF